MAANVLSYYNLNPYRSAPAQQHLAIFSAKEYVLGVMVRVLSPIALRVMILLAGRLNSEGYAKASLDELAKVIRTPRTYVNKGLLELAQHNLISKKKRSEYWISPDVFRPALIEISW